MPPRRPPHPWLKPGLFAGALVPLAVLVWRAARGTLGADAIAIGLNQLGYLALVFLMTSLACTPLKILTGWTWPIRIRRMLGLFAFFYATLHLSTYVVFDRYFELKGILEDVAKRPYITAGMLAFVLMVPLALTSTQGWIRRLGRRWQLLHRLVYLSAIAACFHFLWKVKVMIGEPVYYAAILALLLAARLVWRLRPASSRVRQPARA
jgi:methionine sulfoxide reductase heme-binding subunit